jgi:uncharacterized protein YndB with AHSA1/START domain
MSTVIARTTQVYSVYIKATPEQIWDAITTPEFTERYFHGVRMEIRDGRLWSTLRELAWDVEVLENDPPHRFVHAWTSGYDDELAAEEPSRVTWTIEAQDNGATLLTVVHDRLEGAPKTAANVSGTGWMFVLSNLKTLLETGDPLD